MLWRDAWDRISEFLDADEELFFVSADSVARDELLRAVISGRKSVFAAACSIRSACAEIAELETVDV